MYENEDMYVNGEGFKMHEYITGDPRVTALTDPQDPFENPTENRAYNGDYSDIVPQIAIRGCKLPCRPLKFERRSIRKYYNIGGGILLLNLIFSIAAAVMLSFAISAVMMPFGGYREDPAVSPAITLLTYLVSNLGAFFIGMKLLGLRSGDCFKTTDFTAALAVMYMFIGLFIQFGSGMIISVLTELVKDADIEGQSQDIIKFTSARALVVSSMYTCIVAPITEELFYRGFVMKAFSRVSQRFGIIMSALFFGLAHGNIAQFVLTVLLGIFLGYIDIKHDSVIPSMLVHFAVNLSGTAVSVIGWLYPQGTSEIYGIMTVILMGCAVIGGVLLAVFAKKSTFPKSTIHQQYRCGSVAFTSVPTLVTAALMILMMIDTTFM